MAYVLAFPASITDLIQSYRDWRFEEVRKSNGTPTALVIKDLKFILENELQVCWAIGNGEEVDYETPKGYAPALFLVSFWWHTALEENHEECQRLCPEFFETFEELQEQREHTLRIFYSNAEL